MHNYHIVVRGMDMNMQMYIEIRVRVQKIRLGLLVTPKCPFTTTIMSWFWVLGFRF
jgi:hypothetical protein